MCGIGIEIENAVVARICSLQRNLNCARLELSKPFFGRFRSFLVILGHFWSLLFPELVERLISAIIKHILTSHTKIILCLLGLTLT